MNYHTCRGNCLKLFKKGLLEKSKVGICSFYRLAIPYENELFRISQVKSALFPEIHNLQFYRKDLDCLANQEEGYRANLQFNFYYHFKFGFERYVKILYGKTHNSITIWLRCTDNPLLFEDFKHFITWLEGKTNLNFWTELHAWEVKRWAISVDGKKMEQTPESTLVLSCFAGWFAQQYDKELPHVGLVRRTEIESRNMMEADQFIAMVSGGMTNSQIANAVMVQNRQIDQLREQVRSLTAAIRRIFQIRQQQEEEASQG